MIINLHQATSLMWKHFPRFNNQWQKFIEDWHDNLLPSYRPHTTGYEEFCKYATALLKKEEADNTELDKIFLFIERCFIEGDDSVQNEVGVGFIESLSSWVYLNPSKSDITYSYLRPLSRDSFDACKGTRGIHVSKDLVASNLISYFLLKFPGFTESWRIHLSSWLHPGFNQQLDIGIELEVFAQYTLDSISEDSTGEDSPSKILGFIEEVLESGSDDARYYVKCFYLEYLYMSNVEGFDWRKIAKHLGAKSKQYLNDIDSFWAKEIYFPAEEDALFQLVREHHRLCWYVATITKQETSEDESVLGLNHVYKLEVYIKKLNRWLDVYADDAFVPDSYRLVLSDLREYMVGVLGVRKE